MPTSSRPGFEITAKTVLLGGANSPDSVSGPLLEEIAAAIPRSEVEVLTGLGHLAPQDHADRVAAAVHDHLASGEKRVGKAQTRTSG
jgi:pimeloyl-ACP methyl ester carboxylesterase